LIDIVVDESALKQSAKFDWNEISNRDLIVNDFAMSEFPVDPSRPNVITTRWIELNSAQTEIDGQPPSETIDTADLSLPILDPIEMSDVPAGTEPEVIADGIGSQGPREESAEPLGQDVPSGGGQDVPKSGEQDPAGLLETVLAELNPGVVSVRLQCSTCEHLCRPLELGGVSGVLGAFAWRRPYWCPKCTSFVSLVRLKPAAERKRIAERIEMLGAGGMKTSIDLVFAFDIAALAGAAPRCPHCSSTVRANKAVEAIVEAVDGLASEAKVELKGVRCPECGERRLVAERLP
jgi:DNA-directed RNA polymerase subunit RPC12/RpoP